MIPSHRLVTLTERSRTPRTRTLHERYAASVATFRPNRVQAGAPLRLGSREAAPFVFADERLEVAQKLFLELGVDDLPPGGLAWLELPASQRRELVELRSARSAGTALVAVFTSGIKRCEAFTRWEPLCWMKGPSSGLQNSSKISLWIRLQVSSPR